MTIKKENLYIGIRSTGTETLSRIENETGLLLGSGRAGPANICFSVKDAWHSVNEAFNQALDEAMLDLNKAKEKYLLHAGIGIKGTELEEACISFKEMPHIFQTLVLESDGYIDCLGAHNSKNGKVIVIDEGVVAHQIEDNKCLKQGGWGFPHADEGGAAWLGCEAVRHTLHWQDGLIEKSILLEKIFQRFNTNLSTLVAWATHATPRHYASLAPIVIDHLEEDPIAMKLMQKAAGYITKIFDLLHNKAINKNLPCCLFGGLATTIEPFLPENMKRSLIKPYADGTVGAIFMVKNAILSGNLREDN